MKVLCLPQGLAETHLSQSRLGFVTAADFENVQCQSGSRVNALGFSRSLEATHSPHLESEDPELLSFSFCELERPLDRGAY